MTNFQNLEVLDFDAERIYIDLSNLGKEYVEELKSYQKEIAKTIEETQKQVEKYMQVQSPYLEQLKAEKEVKEELKALDGDYSSQFELAKAYYTEQNKIKNSNKNEEGKEALSWQLSAVYGDKKDEMNSTYIANKGEELGNIVAESLDSIIWDFDNFDKTMRNLTKQLMKSLLNDITDLIFSNLFSLGGDTSILSLLVDGVTGGGILGGLASFALGLFGKSKKHHSGGVIPTASYELGGTGEQLALLKGGERVLSQGENVEYSNAKQSEQPVIFNNFNIKAWDSKDVQKYLLENKNLLNSITYEGIKNNHQHLRSIVGNVG